MWLVMHPPALSATGQTLVPLPCLALGPKTIMQTQYMFADGLYAYPALLVLPVHIMPPWERLWYTLGERDGNQARCHGVSIQLGLLTTGEHGLAMLGHRALV